MPHAPHRKAATRRHILNVARHVFTFSGYESASIDNVMQAAGMTRGAFYAHFENKAALYREAMKMPDDLARTAGLLDLLKRIAIPDCERARAHLQAPLPPVRDMLSAVPEVRQAVGEAVLRLLHELERTNAGMRRAELLALVSMAVGAAVLGDSVQDVVLKSEIGAAAGDTAAEILNGADVSSAASSIFWAPERCEGMASH